MRPSNLPPGVTESMIPGNRPEDDWFETFFDQIKGPDELIGAVDPEVLARVTSLFLEAIGLYYMIGHRAGLAEAREIAYEAFNTVTPFGPAREIDDTPRSFLPPICDNCNLVLPRGSRIGDPCPSCGQPPRGESNAS